MRVTGFFVSLALLLALSACAPQREFVQFFLMRAPFIQVLRRVGEMGVGRRENMIPVERLYSSGCHKLPIAWHVEACVMGC